VLQGPHAELLRDIATPSTALARINLVIRWIRQHFAEPLRVEALAAIAAMSPSAFHRHFKSVTALSPVQFQKRIRLLQARLLLVSGGLKASDVAFDVGYESATQFSREYARFFGAPPAKDAARIFRHLQQAGSAVTAANRSGLAQVAADLSWPKSAWRHSAAMRRTAAIGQRLTPSVFRRDRAGCASAQVDHVEDCRKAAGRLSGPLCHHALDQDLGSVRIGGEKRHALANEVLERQSARVVALAGREVSGHQGRRQLDHLHGGIPELVA
jgi:AraC-like DNA-binding protein